MNNLTTQTSYISTVYKDLIEWPLSVYNDTIDEDKEKYLSVFEELGFNREDLLEFKIYGHHCYSDTDIEGEYHVYSPFLHVDFRINKYNTSHCAISLDDSNFSAVKLAYQIGQFTRYESNQRPENYKIADENSDDFPF